MEKRRLGKKGPELTTVGFGAWALGGGDWAFSWGPQDDADSIRAIHEALELGVNWIDTAAVYGLGHSEEVVGRALRGRRDKVFIATKCALVWDAAGKVSKVLKAPSIRQEIEDSLRRLAVETIDLYQIHWPSKEPGENEEAWGEIAQAVASGKVRFAGVSNFDVAQMKALHKIHPITSLQPPYSMLRREVEKEVLPFCGAEGIGVICYSPMECGLLTGTFSAVRMKSLAADDWRKKSPNFQEPRFSVHLALVQGLNPIAKELNCSLAQLAIAWTLNRPELTAAIVGARRPGQMAETVKASGLRIPPALVEDIETIFEQHAAALDLLPKAL